MRILFIIPGDINLPTGGYRYDREIINAWKNSNIDVGLISIDGNYPFPGEVEKTRALDKIESFSKADIAVVDGLLGGATPEFMQKLSKIMPVAALIHHPLCLENGLDQKTAKALEDKERRGLAFTSCVITTSPTTSRTVAQLFDQDPSQIHTILPGVARGMRSSGTESSSINLLCVGSVIERKGHKDLLHSLSKLKHLDWNLDCIGSTQFDRPLYNELSAFVEREALTKKVQFHGDVDEEVLEIAYSKADVFVLPSLFEGYGMSYAEAIVRGIPVIGTTAGAIPQTVPESCGILVEPSNISQLTNALESLITNNALRTKLREATIKAEPGFPTWQDSAAQFYEILKDTA